MTAERSLAVTGPPAKAFVEVISSGTYLRTLENRAVLGGWAGARSAGLWDTKQSDAVAKAAMSAVLDLLRTWTGEPMVTPRTITLYENEWVSLRQINGDGWAYVFSHETRCKGRIVAALPYRDVAGHREYLVRVEMTPCWGPDPVRSAITGGWEGGDLAEDAAREVREETGYQVTAADLTPLGESFASKSADTVYSLFTVDLTGMEPGPPRSDGTPLDNDTCYAEWVTAADLAQIRDPQVAVMLVRLGTLE